MDGIQHYLGVFNTEEEASLQYLSFAAQHGRTLMPADNDKSSDAENSRKINLLKLVLGKTVKESSYLNLYLANILSATDDQMEEERKEFLVTKYSTIQKQIIELQHFILIQIAANSK